MEALQSICTDYPCLFMFCTMAFKEMMVKLFVLIFIVLCYQCHMILHFADAQDTRSSAVPNYVTDRSGFGTVLAWACLGIWFGADQFKTGVSGVTPAGLHGRVKYTTASITAPARYIMSAHGG